VLILVLELVMSGWEGCGILRFRLRLRILLVRRVRRGAQGERKKERERKRKGRTKRTKRKVKKVKEKMAEEKRKGATKNREMAAEEERVMGKEMQKSQTESKVVERMVKTVICQPTATPPINLLPTSPPAQSSPTTLTTIPRTTSAHSQLLPLLSIRLSSA
jgi:hypothetical protein